MRTRSWVLVIFAGAAAVGLAAGDEISKVERLVAIDNVCAWPNLKLLPNGDLLAVIFNQPCHGTWEGDVECWASTDGGRTWRKRGIVAPHEPGTNRMNVAVGFAHNGDLVVIASGYGDRPKPGTAAKGYPMPLPSWVCRSSDAGKTWTHAETVKLPANVQSLIPYGDIIRTKPGKLEAACYSMTRRTPDGKYGKDRFFNAMVMTSSDDGKTWEQVRSLGDARRHNETALLALSDKDWLAAIRGVRDSGLEAVQLFASDDGGQKWTYRAQLSEPAQIPAHLLRLRDGRILLTFGSRTAKYWGVGYRISSEEGKTWTEPKVLVDFGDTRDGGYPSSVELKDGTVVTAFYAGSSKLHPRYHMGVCRWRPGK